MQIVDATAARRALVPERLIPALRRAFAEGCSVPARQVHAIETANGATLTSLVMPAWGLGGRYGVKIVNVAPGNAGPGLPALHASYLLFDAVTGVPLALIDGDAITAHRTASASALAASHLARADATRLLVVGAGRVARLLPDAYRAVRPIAQVSVWARRPEAAEALASDWLAAGLPATAAPDLEAAVRAADVVACATLAAEPLVAGRWLGAGSHLDLIGGFTPRMREADDDCFAGASVFVDTEEALAKSGDLLGPIGRGVLRPGDVRGTLAELVRGEVSGRADAQERTVFKSVGTALEDLAAATLVYDSLGHQADRVDERGRDRPDDPSDDRPDDRPDQKHDRR